MFEIVRDGEVVERWSTIHIQFYPNIERSYISSRAVTLRKLKSLLSDPENSGFYVLTDNRRFTRVLEFDLGKPGICKVIVQGILKRPA